MVSKEKQINCKVRKVTSRGTPSYQLGHYEMQGPAGKRRSVFKVDVHLGEHPTPEEALTTWSSDIDHLRNIGRENQVTKLEGKLEKLQRLRQGMGMEATLTTVDPHLTPTQKRSGGRVKVD